MKPTLRLITALLVASLAALHAADAPPKKPNVLWFVVDDMSANFSCYGETLIQTPNVDRLAREGTRFANAFVTAPVCSPCRSALITGMYQTSIGAHHHRSGRGVEKIRLPEGVVPVPALFQKAGYFTCIGSGLQNAGTPVRKRDSGLGKTDYNFEYDAAIFDSHDWAGRRPDQPFFMQVQLAGGKLRGGNDGAATRLIETAAKEFGAATEPEKVTLPPYYPRDPVLLRDWAAYLDSVRLTDAHVGKVVARLEQEGLLENTFIIFITDHGISHARGKQFLYDEGTHIPFIVRGPGIEKGKVRADLIEHIDMAAISLAAAGIEIPKTMQGRNVLAPDYQPRAHVFAARDRCDETADRIRSVRSERWKYIRNFLPQRPYLQPNDYKDHKPCLIALRAAEAAGQLNDVQRLLFAKTRAPEELYDLAADPWEVKNLAADPAHAATLLVLRTRLDRWMEQTNDQGRTPETEARYDAEMAAYIGKGNPEVEKNIAIMKQWAKEGK